MKKELFDWFFKKDQQFSIEAVEQLVEDIKVFNAGAIDQYLTNHVDQVFEKWLEDQRGSDGA